MRKKGASRVMRCCQPDSLAAPPSTRNSRTKDRAAPSSSTPHHARPRAETAIFSFVVDAKDEKTMGFHQHLGFRRFTSRPSSLFLTLATALQALADVLGK